VHEEIVDHNLVGDVVVDVWIKMYVVKASGNGGEPHDVHMSFAISFDIAMAGELVCTGMNDSGPLLSALRTYI
jgi:hypothetical protein